MSAGIQWIFGALVIAMAIWLLLWASPSSREPPVGQTERSRVRNRFSSMGPRTEQNREPRE